MNRETNEEIVVRLQKGQGNRTDLFEILWVQNRRLIRRIIHEFTGLNWKIERDRLNFEDMEQQAFLGMMRAVKRYDPESGAKFMTCAVYSIRGTIARYYSRCGQSMRIPEYMRANIRRCQRAAQELAESGESITTRKLQECSGLSERVYKDTIRAMRCRKILSLDCNIYPEDPAAGTLSDVIPDQKDCYGPVIECLYQKELHDLLMKAIRELPDRERRVLTYRHLVGTSTGDLAGYYECSIQNIYLILESAYKKIRVGKYGKELSGFLPYRSKEIRKARIKSELLRGLSQSEANLLL